MADLLMDVNLQGHLEYLQQVMESLGLSDLLASERVDFHIFPDFGLPPTLTDRLLWEFCQSNGLVLCTDNRNLDSPDSLQATLDDSVLSTSLPVLTISNKNEFERGPEYAVRVAKSVAEVLYGLTVGDQYRGIARLFVPLPQYP